MFKTYKTLLKVYGPQGWWPINGKYHNNTPLNEKQRFEICVGAILTQNTSWINVEKALRNLRKHQLLSPKAIIKAIHLPQIIKPAGYYNQKACKLKEFAKFYLKLKGKTPTRQNLLSIWGVGPETADTILLYAYNQPHFIIDTYTRRFTNSRKETYDELQQLFHSKLSQDSKLFQEFHALIVEHGKKHNPKRPACAGCPICKSKLYKKQF